MADRLTGARRQTRSVVHAAKGMVVTSHPLAAQAGLDILRQGGNAFDAAVATAAVLCVVEPMMTGLGGDMFALLYDAKRGEVQGLNASGRAPKAADAAAFAARGLDRIPEAGPLSVSVPGVVDGWAQLLERYGSLTFREVLAPAITYAEEGVPVAEMVAYYWRKGADTLRNGSAAAAAAYLVEGEAPAEGMLFRQPGLAWSLRQLAAGGRDVFYTGVIADRIDAHMREAGGLLRKADLAAHHSEWVKPIETMYRDYRVLEIPPNGQGLVVLQMLNLLERFDLQALGHNSAAYMHLLAEVKRLAYRDRDRYIADSEYAAVPVERLLSKAYAEELAGELCAVATGLAGGKVAGEVAGKATGKAVAGEGLELGGDTVYLAVADAEGNVVSVTNSIFQLFGSGEVVADTGICLHNRASLFTLQEGHPNRLAPGKRPFHTIIPALVLQGERPVLALGVMGADMQPQGQVQTLLNWIDFGMNVQLAGEVPRFRHYNEGLYLESEIPQKEREALDRLGYQLLSGEDGDAFAVGGYQAIEIEPVTGLYRGGSDPRKDGCAAGY